MADLPLFPFTTQEDWYGELAFLSADASQEAISLEGRSFEMPITPAGAGSTLIEPVKTLTMEAGGGLSLKAGAPNTLVFRVPRDVARAFARSEYTADVLEVVSGERHLFMPVRIRYSEPSGILSFISRFVGVSVSFSARLQPIISPVAITGRQGAPGATIVTGLAPPVPADGKNGDYWIEDRTGSNLGRRMYGPKTGGAWPPSPWTIQVTGIADVPGLSVELTKKTSRLDFFTLGISRAEIPNNVIPLNSFVLAGFYAVGDGGAGARYVRGAAGDFLAIQDAAGVWFKLDVRGGRLRMGWLGMVAGDASAATAAANAVAMNGAMKVLDEVCHGGTIEGAGYFYVSATIDNRYPRIMVEGPGRDFVHDTGSAPFGLTFAATGAIEVLRHRTPSAADAGVTAAQNQKVSGGGFQRLNVMGGLRCLRVTSTAFGTYDLAATNATGTETVLFDCLPDYRRPDVSQMGEASDTQHAYIHLRLRQDGDAATRAAHCLVFRGYNGCGNPSYIFGAVLEARHANGRGLVIENGDNIVFESVRTAQVGGNGGAFLIQAATTEGGFSGVNDAIEFRHYASNTSGYVEGVPGRANATTPGELTIWKVDSSNGTQPPSAGAGAYLTIHEINGLTYGLKHTGLAAGETLSSAFQSGRRRRASTTAHLFNTSNDHACLDDGNNRWGISLDSATGNLRFTCEVGSGIVEMPRAIFSRRVSASSDDDAASKGVKLGEDYYNTTGFFVRPRTA